MALTNQQGKLVLANDANTPVEFTVDGSILNTSGNKSSGNIVTRGLISYWKLEESSLSSNAVLDTAFSSYNVGSNPANHGTRFGTAPITTAGVSGNAHSFSGDDYVAIANESNFDDEWTQPRSVSFWIYKTVDAAGVIFAKSGGDGNDKGFRVLYFPTGHIRIQLIHSNASRYIESWSNSGTSHIPLNQWRHIVFTYNGNGTSSGVKFYDNGALLPTGNHDVGGGLTGGDTILNNSIPTIGARSELSEFIAGNLDEVMYYNVELTAEEVSQNYRAAWTSIVTAGLVSYWKLEESSLAADAVLDTAFTTFGVGSNPGNHGTRFGTTPIVLGGVSGNAHSFSGDDYITIANESNFDFERTDKFSINAWVNVSSFAAQRRIFVKWNGDIGYYFLVSGSGGLRMTLSGTGTNGVNEIDVVSSGTTLVLNRWYHVAMTYNGSSVFTGVKMYIDGVLQTTNDNSGGATLTTTILNNNTPLIGINNDLSGEPFVGLIDEVAVYNVELTQAQVIQNMNSVYNTIEKTGLVCWYRFEPGSYPPYLANEGSAGPGYNLVNNGTPIEFGKGPALGTAAGKFSPSSGANRSFDIPNVRDLFGSTASISFWINLNAGASASGNYLFDGTEGMCSVEPSRVGNRISINNTSNMFDNSAVTGADIRGVGWTMITLTQNSTTMKLYRTDETTYPGTLLLKTTTDGPYIPRGAGTATGQLGSASNATHTSALEGYVDSVKLYNIELTPAQILRNFQVER